MRKQHDVAVWVEEVGVVDGRRVGSRNTVSLWVFQYSSVP